LIDVASISINTTTKQLFIVIKTIIIIESSGCRKVESAWMKQNSKPHGSEPDDDNSFYSFKE